MESGTLSTNKIMIRGIGARNLFGTANIRTYFGDIPLTDGNGESSIEDLELSSLSRIEVFKGPSSSTYGVGLGGTILLQPEYTDYKSANSIISISAGSFGRLVVKTAIGGEKFGVNLIYGNNHTDGYRNNNEYNRHTLTIISSIYGGENDSFSLIGSYVNLKAGILSSLDRKGF
ncbi:TonB-dependent receptor plug domain-containing protein [Confluentibacter flavum]|uniref:TonB-dependent receptor plug domain-containing protein n=1 Tax=Confluentibacter flavum TaxID=1909700 RepID=A0A2N3HKB7_9FLAO|nr:TonB-dependent receptor plug domain-containing protein [Confluentibacter flavum]PKQ45381.1 hypothetical protein CSW08_08425 [Confluentibacter flavum]